MATKKAGSFEPALVLCTPLILRLAGALALAADVVALEVLQRAVLRDGLVDVRGRGVLDALAGHLAGEDERERVATLSSLRLTLGRDRSRTLRLSLRGLSVLSIGIGIHVVVI